MSRNQPDSVTATGAGDPPGDADPAKTVSTPRIASLDWARGLMLIASVGVNSFAIVPVFRHAQWASVTVLDLIFPLFVTLSGCGLAFALHKRVKSGPLIRRSLILMVLGLLYNAVVTNQWQLSDWRVTGVLQMYAAIVVVMGLMHLVTRTWVGWAVVTALFTVAHSTLLSIFAAGCAAGVLTPDCNPSGALDAALFGSAHMYAGGMAGHDPEGMVATLGALISASAGATVGHLLLSLKRRESATARGPWAAFRPVLGIAATFLVLAFVVSYLPELFGGSSIPAMKRLWTAPFALAVAAITALMLLAGHILLDRPTTSTGLRRASFPLLALGRNSLLVYFGSHVLMSLLARPVGNGPSVIALFESVAGSGMKAQLLWTAIVLSFWIGLAALLHRHKIYLRP